MDNNELQHWGVRGMKWGVRRYQNKDGSLTAAGKKRYDKELEKAKAEAKIIKGRERTQAKLDKLKALQEDNASRKAALDQRKAEEKLIKFPKRKEKPIMKKSVEDLTDEELASVVRRLQLEKQLADLTPKKVKNSKGFVENAVKPAMNDAGKRLLTDFAVKKGKTFLGLDDKPTGLESVVKDLRLKKEHKELSDYLNSKPNDLESIVKDLKNEKTRRQLEDWIKEDDKKRSS